MHSRIFSSIHGIYTLDAHSITLPRPVVTAKNVSRHCQRSPVTEQTGRWGKGMGVQGMIYCYQMDPPLCCRGPPPHTRFALPGKECLSMPETGEKERDYLFKELYKLKSNNLMSSLRSQSLLEYPQTHSPSFPLCPVQGTVSQKKGNRILWFSAQATWSQKDTAWLPRLGLNPSANLPLQHHFQLLPQLDTAANIPIFFQLSQAAIESPGRCGPVVWSQSSPSSHPGFVTRGGCLLVTSSVEVTPVPLAQTLATAL
ncbi:hypothetical protein HJG60_010915 [Phyllostomus discolor]|uniref:Uncharacterized protein n=1 Tax=Phyllostomus discolor TaxID=89673 RepID=A0A834AHN6_9CHIR|nr:hypothetical protein HJG60_010915 [Phyllostomus discolor]